MNFEFEDMMTIILTIGILQMIYGFIQRSKEYGLFLYRIKNSKLKIAVF